MNIRERFGTLCSRLGVELQCPHCYSNNIIKSGKSSTGKQRYRCKHCQKRFITDYTYKAYLPNSDTKITQLTKEGLGIRSTARILGISLPPCCALTSESCAPCSVASVVTRCSWLHLPTMWDVER